MNLANSDYLVSVKRLCPKLSEMDLSQFASKVTTIKLRKKDFFLQAGKIQKAMGYVSSGLIRAFYIDDEGNERTIGFNDMGEYATDFSSFVNQVPSRYSLQCLEDTELACLSLESINWLYEHSPQFERYGRLVTQNILHKQQARIESFIFLTSEQRYLNFIEQNPTLNNRISLSHLCSFLGIERQTLTRIRQKLSRK